MALDYFDTHAHIQFPDYGLDADETWQSAKKAGVSRMIAVGCRLEDSKLAVDFAQKHQGVWAAVGIHPHEAGDFLSTNDNKENFAKLLTDTKKDRIVAIGETGLDYYYNHSTKADQIELLEFQINLAEEYDLPVIFHVRDAFSDFWPVFDKFNVKKAVIHSFTGVQLDVVQILKRGLFVGLNGIITFTKENKQIEAVKQIPLESIILETDAPYLTPKPFRGKICKPEYVKLTAAHLAELRGEPVEQVASVTSRNAQRLFNIEI